MSDDDSSAPANRALPRSRFGRIARLAALGAKAGSARLSSALGSDDAEAKLAQSAAAALGNLRGLAAKVGQMASYVDGVVPVEHRDLYESTMASLRNAAPTMSEADARAQVVADLGAPPEELFRAWTATPFASASIGQVHRAVTHKGVEVAVKIQYRGIADAVHADLRNADLFGALIPLGSKLGVKEHLKEVQARFREELDYEHEAAQQQRFAAIFSDDATIHVPRVLGELSGGLVITSEFVSGHSFEAACAGSEDERKAWATTLWRFVFQSLLGHGLFNADPHPGNYIFGDGGKIWFLDYGCTRQIAPLSLERVRNCHAAAVEQRFDDFYGVAESMFDMAFDEGPTRDLVRSYTKSCFAPIWTPEPYRMTREFAGSLLTDMRTNAKYVLRHDRKNLKPMPAEWLFFNRLQLGFYSVLARLDVPVNYHEIERQLLLDAGVL